MPSQFNKLSAVAIRRLKKPGRYSDGGGLYLFIKKNGERFWVFRYRDRTTQKHRDMGLGPERDVSLKEARDKAVECRSALREGVDPIDSRREARLAAMVGRAHRLKFKECAQRYIEAHRDSWNNAKHVYQWERTLEIYAADLMPLPVASIDTALVLKCLEPIWKTKTETATRVRQRIEAVLDWATVRKYRTGENPARWKGHLDKLLPKPAKLKNVQHLPALEYREMGAFMSELREVNSLAACALELQILTATRPGEVVGARWEEFDLKNALWAIPAERMKAKKEHVVPLSEQAVSLLKSLPETSEYVFPGLKPGRHITTAAAMKCTKGIREGVTNHGFRSTFRDWAADQTNFPREVCEHALAHQLSDGVEAAYHRKTMLPKRTKLMQTWANYCDQQGDHASVTPIRKGGAK